MRRLVGLIELYLAYKWLCVPIMYLKLHVFTAVVGLQYLSAGMPSASHGTSIMLTGRLCLCASGNLHQRQLPSANRPSTEVPMKSATKPSSWNLEQIAYILSAVEQWLLAIYQPLASDVPVHNPTMAPMATPNAFTAVGPINQAASGLAAGLPVADLLGSPFIPDAQMGDVSVSRVTLGGPCNGECGIAMIAKATGFNV
jgi:hypothetical protein